MPALPSLLALTVFPLLVIVAAIGDVRTMRIPNKLNAAIALSFFPVALMAGMPWGVMGMHLLAFAVVLAAMMGLFFWGKIGGGDAKMIAAASLWVGWGEPLLIFFVVTALAGGILAVIMKLWEMLRVEQGVWGADGALRKTLARSLDLPYGVAIAAGALVAYPTGWWQSVLFAA